MKKTYIVKKSLLSSSCTNQYYYLKLNRTAQYLEVYEQADNHRLRELYTLREDFDTSDYALFTLKKSIHCIFGGEGRTRTPVGIFYIEHVSGLHEEYISPYHPQHERAIRELPEEIREYVGMVSDMVQGNFFWTFFCWNTKRGEKGKRKNKRNL